MLPAFPHKQAAGDEASFRAQAGLALQFGLFAQGPQQGGAMSLALMAGVAIEQGDSIGGFAQSECDHCAVVQAAHQSLPMFETGAKAVGPGSINGLGCPGMPLKVAVELGRASLHRLAIDLQGGLHISIVQGSQHLHLPVGSVFRAGFSPNCARLAGRSALDVVGSWC